ncbi:MAG: hypothetical protein HKO81_09295 [Flavobacteriaceae bacterium]|nr:hypothetical protein [Bacteroidia bacterium]NNL16820.1 hypothetical protein [Flavobacteriaceae bacterium]
MRIYSKFIVFIMVFGTINVLNAQKDSKCKVINEDTLGTYEGKCKKGLAHGTGLYKFSDGERYYEGKFKKGKFYGKGEIYKINNGQKEVLEKGIWENNKYLGEKKINAYEVNRTENVDRYTIRKVAEGKRVEISFFQNGVRNNVQNLNIFVNNGIDITGTNIRGFQVIEFPFKCEITYVTQNKFKTITYRVQFDFIINEPGAWDVFLYN